MQNNRLFKSFPQLLDQYNANSEDFQKGIENLFDHKVQHHMLKFYAPLQFLMGEKKYLGQKGSEISEQALKYREELGSVDYNNKNALLPNKKVDVLKSVATFLEANLEDKSSSCSIRSFYMKMVNAFKKDALFLQAAGEAISNKNEDSKNQQITMSMK